MSRADLYKNVQSEINALMKRIEELEAALSLAEKMDETKAGLITELEAENQRLHKMMEATDQLCRERLKEYGDENTRLKTHIEEMIDDVKGLGYGYPRSWEAY